MTDSVEVTVAVVTGSFSLVATTISAFFAYRAARNSKPVSNGFTVHVRKELEYLRQRLDAHIDAGPCRHD